MAALIIAVALIAAVEVTPAAAQIYDVLYTFSPYTGAWPYGTLVRDSDGNLYGTTAVGGLMRCGDS